MDVMYVILGGIFGWNLRRYASLTKPVKDTIMTQNIRVAVWDEVVMQNDAKRLIWYMLKNFGNDYIMIILRKDEASEV